MRGTAAGIARLDGEQLDPQIAEALRMHVVTPLRDVLRELADTPEPAVLRSVQRRIDAALGALQALAPARGDLDQASAALTDAQSLFESVATTAARGALRRWREALAQLRSAAAEDGADGHPIGAGGDPRRLARASVLPALESAVEDLAAQPAGHTTPHALNRLRDRWSGLPEQIAATRLPGSGDSAALVRAGLRTLATAPTLPVGRVIGHVARARRLVVDACA